MSNSRSPLDTKTAKTTGSAAQGMSVDKDGVMRCTSTAVFRTKEEVSTSTPARTMSNSRSPLDTKTAKTTGSAAQGMSVDKDGVMRCTSTAVFRTKEEVLTSTPVRTPYWTPVRPAKPRPDL